MSLSSPIAIVYENSNKSFNAEFEAPFDVIMSLSSAIRAVFTRAFIEALGVTMLSIPSGRITSIDAF